MKSAAFVLFLSITALACGSSSGGATTTADAGVDAATAITDTCTATHNCSCLANQVCNFTCSGSDTCNASCEDSATCSLQCASGECTLDCSQDAACSMVCGSGLCTGNGNVSDAFTQTCGSGSCNLQCTDVGNCKQNTSSGAHNCSGCD
jgi:hypothetical protein